MFVLWENQGLNSVVIYDLTLSLWLPESEHIYFNLILQFTILLKLYFNFNILLFNLLFNILFKFY